MNNTDESYILHQVNTYLLKIKIWWQKTKTKNLN